jgi:hypothetical protein
MKMKSLLVTMCLCLSAFTLGCVAMDDPVTSDESALEEGPDGTGITTPQPPEPPRPLPPQPPGPLPPLPPQPPPGPPRGCVIPCVLAFQECKAHATNPFEACLCLAQESRCFGGCGMMSPMPRCGLE